MADTGASLSLVPASSGDWTVEHAIPGRIRFRAEQLKDDAGRCLSLRRQLSLEPGISSVTTTPLLGTLTLRYERRRLSGQDVQELFQRTLDKLQLPDARPESLPGASADVQLLALLGALLATPLLPLPARYLLTLAAISPSLWQSVTRFRDGGRASHVLDSGALLLSTLAGRYGVAQVNNLMHVLALRLEKQAVDDTESKLRQRALPPQAEYAVLRGGNFVSAAAEDLQAGDTLRLSATEMVPLESIVIRGSGQISVAFTPDRADAGPGHRVSAGSELVEGELEMVCLRDWTEGNFARMASFIEIAIRNRQNHDLYTARMAERLVPVTVLISAAVYGFTRDLARASSAAQADFGAAAELVTPVSVESSIAAGATRGILYRGGDVIERLAGLDTLVFDRSGTLTRAEWKLVQINALGKGSEEECQKLLDSLLYHCCRADVLASCGGELPPLVTLSHAEVEQVQQHGLHMRHEGKLLSLVTLTAAQQRFGIDNVSWGTPLDRVGVLFFLVVDGELAAIARFSDSLSPGNIAGLEALRRQGIENMYLISQESTASLHPELASLPLNGFHTGLREMEKLHFIQELLDRGDRVGLVSDGLFRAGGDCLNICLGTDRDARPLDADVWLMAANIRSLAEARELAMRSADRLKKSHRLSQAGKGSMLLASSFDMLPPALAAALGNATTVATMRWVLNIDGGESL